MLERLSDRSAPSLLATGTPWATRKREVGAEFSHVAWLGVNLKPWKLNPPQELAVQSALHTELSLIHGPPGTGKTTTASSLCAMLSEFVSLRREASSSRSPTWIAAKWRQCCAPK